MPVLTPLSVISSILCIGGDDEFGAAISVAVPGAKVVRLNESELWTRAPAARTELVALCDAAPEAIDGIGGAQDDAGLPRWPVALFASEAVADRVDVLAKPEWTPRAMLRAFGAALVEHALRRQNAELRGDLATFGLRIAHDLRTPLGGVFTTTEMLREILSEDAPADVALTQPILDSADSLVKLIERMSFFAKAASSTERLQRFNMGTAFWNAFQQLEGKILKAGAVLKHAREWPDVDGHPAWMEAVWRLLIGNALQHGGAGVRMEAGWTTGEGMHRFWLRDSGEVPVEKRATLFYPFNRLHSPGAPRGLGLAIVRRLIERQDGVCGFEPAAAGGSCFFFTLPAKPSAPNSSPPGMRV